MITSATLAHFRWHAGFDEKNSEGAPSIASATWPRGRFTRDFQRALEDCINSFIPLNEELNGDVPSTSTVHSQDVPRALVYALTEIIRMIRECADGAGDENDANAFARAAWRVEAAWSAVLAGDIDDILKHLEQEEAMRFG